MTRWVFSTDLTTAETGSHAAFDPSTSSTFETIKGASFKISYGDGSGASGLVGTDTVNIGGATVTSQAVEVATSVSASFVSDTSSDGLVGLAFSILNTVTPTQQKTFFANIMDSLEQPVFTADLDESGQGSFEFGVIDSSKYSGSIQYTDIDSSNGFWQFTSASYSIAGKTYTNTNASPAIADTGTSLVLLDEAVVEAYYAQIKGASVDETVGGYVYPCSATLPAFGVAIGDHIATIPASGITFAKVDSETCFGGIQSNGGSGIQIMGDVLLRQHFVVFDGGNLSIGFAAKAA